jgi:transposase-like protein
MKTRAISEIKKDRYIQSSTETIHSLATEVYETLMDREYDPALEKLDEIASIARDLKKSFTDEI